MKSYIKVLMILPVVLLMNNACTDNFEEMNTPKDLITADVIDLNLLFTRVLGISIVESDENGMGTIGNYSGMSYSGANRPFQSGGSTGRWNGTYGNYARNLSDIVHLASTRENSADLVNKKAVARILRVWVYARTTDVYGNIPYFESTLPIEDAVSLPKYDSQRDIYVDLFKELREAVAEMDDSAEKFSSADILYGGDLNKWKKFANSLRLRLALRLRYVDPVLAADEMADLTEANLITIRAEDASIYNTSEYANQMNDQFADLQERGGNVVVKRLVPKTFIDILNNNHDPRLKVFADTAKATFPGDPNHPDYGNVDYFGYRGTPLLGMAPVEQGYAYGNETTSRWSDILWVQIQELPLFKASETYYALAEAALFGLKGSPADAQGYYTKGLELALAHTKEMFEAAEPQLFQTEKLFLEGSTDEEVQAAVDLIIDTKKLTQDEIDYFLENEPVATLSGSDEEKLEQIINQKMIALYPQEQEGWSEYRRTGYPRILIGDDADALEGVIPRRMPWPTDEQLINGDQYDSALEIIGGKGMDNRLTKIWWDANPNPIHDHPEEVEWREQPWVDALN